MRAVLDVNVLISATLSPTEAPARLLVAWQTGAFELIVSPALLAELERALGYPRLRRLVTAVEGDEFVGWLERSATMVPDPKTAPPVTSIDPGDDHLIALAADQRAMLVSGDAYLTTLAETFPVVTPAGFLAMLEER